MKILIVNDDGYKSPLLDILAKSALKYGEVTVFSPAKEQSAKSHAMHFWTGNIVKEVRGRSYKLFKVYGTPADCTKVGLALGEYDLVLSGINNGLNIGNDIHYSGTCGAACEAVLHGIKAIAFSAFWNNIEETISGFEPVFNHVMDMLIDEEGLYFYNVNFPKDMKNIKGYRFTEMGNFIDTAEAVKKGCRYFYKEHNFGYDLNNLNIDYSAVNAGFVSITPLSVNFTDYKRLNNKAQ